MTVHHGLRAAAGNTGSSGGGGSGGGPTDITTSFYEISNRFIDSQSYMGNSADYNGPYDVGEIDTDFTGTGRVYIGVKVTSSTTYYNDVPIAGVQIISGTTLVRSWIFNSTTGGSGTSWQTAKQQIAGSLSLIHI